MRMRRTSLRPARIIGALLACLAATSWARADDGEKAARGRELFLREWTVGDPRSHGGDGLGPVFNDSSCVACHNAGGAGGAGPASKNVDILSAFANAAPSFVVETPAGPTGSFREKVAQALLGIDPPKAARRQAPPSKPRKPDTAPLIKAHAGFKTSRSVVLHKFGSDPKYDAWRNEMLGLNNFAPPAPPGFLDPNGKANQDLMRARLLMQTRAMMAMGTQVSAGEFTLTRSQRNPTSLFGSGLIDSIPESVLIANAERQQKQRPATAGRVAKQKDGRIGRFGWKAQTPSLDDFVLTACAVELGLEVPGHGGLPKQPDLKAKGLDMDASECDALVAYVKGLPKPAETNAEMGDVKAGRALFAKIGCAACHQQKLGDVEGIYSDLLVHDLGPDLGDTGQYGVFTPGSSDPEFEDDPIQPEPTPDGVAAVEELRAEFQAGIAPPAARGMGVMMERAALTFASLFSPQARRMRDIVFVDTFPPTPVPATQAPTKEASDARLDIAQEPTPPAPPAEARPVPLDPKTTPAQPDEAVEAPIAIAPVRREPAGTLPTPPVAPPRPKGPAGRQEWRTPPLWGVRDSAPYLHDGRADTIEQAIALHGGQSEASALAYFGLSAKQRRQIDAFLKSLTAPTGMQ